MTTRSTTRALKGVFGTVLVAAMVTVAAPAGADPGGEPVTPMIIGGDLATETYTGMGSLQRKADQWHSCAVWLSDLSPRHAITNAHCVTTYPTSTPRDASLYQVRFGSNNRLDGGKLVGIKRILPHAAWNWGAGTGADADIAVLELDQPVRLKPFHIPTRTPAPSSKRTTVRAIGWGLTSWPGWTGPAPVDLSQLTMDIVDPSSCAAADIGVGEICVIGPDSATGICFGDSGSPVLQRSRHWGTRWDALGGFSRAVDEQTCTGAAVMTDAAYYRTWIRTVIRTGVVPPAPAHATSIRSNTPNPIYQRANQQAG
ncbi:S1 family peptidase [Phytohabitans aurantiacus]|uniref:Serine protease n=1 Tax=Phytohabitans aurantiacus TaxID=3016789 RepID=A0ABQ5R131_9ACTN|nr:trypsin-like serine protease [Phytohabitans aurantiacus]GLH99886.1 serine protease [Phytohabitans aurantiacus]